MTQNLPNFDRIARPYRWLEYLTLGPLLERTRLHHLPALSACRHALVLGDGDGRFAAHLLRANLHLHVHAVDLSPAMLRLLHRNAAPHAARLRTTLADARHLTPPPATDLVVTHFFLDCLTQPETDALIAKITPTLTPDALWLVSEFQVPPGILRRPAQAYLAALYAAFRLLTGLQVRSVPDYATPLRAAGLVPTAVAERLGGLLTTSLWQAQPKTK